MKSLRRFRFRRSKDTIEPSQLFELKERLELKGYYGVKLREQNDGSIHLHFEHDTQGDCCVTCQIPVINGTLEEIGSTYRLAHAQKRWSRSDGEVYNVTPKPDWIEEELS